MKVRRARDTRHLDERYMFDPQTRRLDELDEDRVGFDAARLIGAQNGRAVDPAVRAEEPARGVVGESMDV